MSERQILLNLLFFYPKAFLLLQYLILISEGKESFHFYVDDIRHSLPGASILLKREQVRRYLTLLQDHGLIKFEKVPYSPRRREVTLLYRGGFDV